MTSTDLNSSEVEGHRDGIDVRIDGHVARITIDRPDVLNALDGAAQRRLAAIWEALESRDDVRAAVLTGAGDRAFCVGSDMRNVDKSGVEYWADTHPEGYGGLTVRRTLDIPVIARVNGYALGGGFELVLGCDLVVAADTAQFGLPEPRVGRLPLDGGIPTLVRQIPTKWAMELLLTGKRITAVDAARMGLVNEVVTPDQLDEAIERWLSDLLACAPLSVRAIKQLLNRTEHMTPADAASVRLPGLVHALRSADSDEGVAAFQEKRPPQWSGR